MNDRQNEHDPAQHGDELGEYGSEQQNWQEQPPVDDFSDQPVDGVEEAAAVTEEASNEAVVEEAPKKNNLKLLPIVAGVLSAIFVAAMLYLQFGGGESSPASMAVPAAEVMGNVAPPPALPATNTPSPDDAHTGEVDLGAIYNAANSGSRNNDKKNNGTAMPSAAEGVAVSSDMVVAEPAPAAAPAPVVPASVVPAKSTAPVPLAEPLAQAPQPPVALSKPGPDVAALEQRINDLTAKLDAVQKNLDRSLEQINQTAAAMPATVEERLRVVEQKVSEAGNAKVAPSDDTSMPRTLAGQVPSEQKPTELLRGEKRRASSSKHAHKGVAAKSRHESVKKHKNAPHTVENGRWILRGATEGSAWVSKTSSSDELRQVEVGQDLPGIGRVKAIRQDQSGWVIIGTKGNVR